MLWIRNFWHLLFTFMFMRSESLASLDAPVCLWPHLAKRSRVAVFRGCTLLAGAGGHVVWRPPPHCSFPHLCQCHPFSASSLLSWILVHHPPNTNSPKQEPWTHTSPLHICHVDTSHHASFVFYMAVLCLSHRLVDCFQPDCLLQPLMSEVLPSWEGPGPISGLKSLLHTLQGHQSRSALVFGLFPALQHCLLSFILQYLASLSFLLHRKLKAGKAW